MIARCVVYYLRQDTSLIHEIPCIVGKALDSLDYAMHRLYNISGTGAPVTMGARVIY
jgi:hypothetical protein